jgi:hypothetical protein
MDEPFVMLGFIIWLICVAISAVVGAKRGNPLGGTFLGVVLGPIGLLIVLLSEDKYRVPCPFCAEKIQKKAKICPFCRKELNV